MEGKKYWLISVEKTREDSFNTLNKKTNDELGLSFNYKFPVPDLKVGTLDSLMLLTDQLDKIDTLVMSTTRKIALQLFDIVDVKETTTNSKYDSLTVNNYTIDQYLQYWKWEEGKYAPTHPLKTLSDLIHTQVAKIDEELKIKANEYTNLVHALASEERKAGGNLLTRDLSDLIKPSHVVDSEYMETLFVAVPKFSFKQWASNYERLTDFVLPRSSEMIEQDNEYGLFRVVVFRRVADDFKNAARDSKFIVRDFKYDPQRSGKADKKKLEAEKEKLRKALIRWCKTNFSETFVAWIHLKAIRVFVESVLRYGLPTNFQAIILLPNKNKANKLRKTLHQLYGDSNSKALYTEKPSVEEEEGGEEGQFFPYVFLEINVDFQPNAV